MKMEPKVPSTFKQVRIDGLAVEHLKNPSNRRHWCIPIYPIARETATNDCNPQGTNRNSKLHSQSTMSWIRWEEVLWKGGLKASSIIQHEGHSTGMSWFGVGLNTGWNILTPRNGRHMRSRQLQNGRHRLYPWTVSTTQEWLRHLWTQRDHNTNLQCRRH